MQEIMIDKHILEKVISTANVAAGFIRKEKEQFRYEQVKVKGLNDLVSHVDKKTEELVVASLRDILPGAGYIVEENTASGRKDMNWIVDPLDGTTNFIHGVPSYAVSIALEHQGEVILGVVHEVSRDECFSAIRDGGSYLNGKRIGVSQRESLSESLVGTGFPVYNFERMSGFMSALEYFIRNTHGVRRIGAASVDLCYLACGRLDAFFEYNLHPWDVAAGALIVKEAGGKVCDFSGGGNWLFGKEMVASNPLIENELLEVLKKHF